MGRDPLVIKETRLDAILGVTRVMGSAYGGADEVRGAILFLIGEKDEIIPLKAMEKTAMRLSGDVTFRRYPEGWHLLFRDLQAETVWRDVADWIEERVDAALDQD
jgi:alpha-beta hydrolase superfamily lysophospholipase